MVNRDPLLPAKNRVAKDRDVAPACPPAAIWEADAGTRPAVPSRPIPPRVRVITRLRAGFAPAPETSAIFGDWRETAGAPPLRTAVPEPGVVKARVWMCPSSRAPALTVLPARLLTLSMQAAERRVAGAPHLDAGIPQGSEAPPLFPYAIQVERAGLARLADGIALGIFPCRIPEPELARTGPRFAFDSVLPAGIRAPYCDAQLHPATRAAAPGWTPRAEGLKPKNAALAPILTAAEALPPQIRVDARCQPGMPADPNAVWLAPSAVPAPGRCREDGPFTKPAEMGLPAVRKPSAEPAALPDSGFAVWTRSSNRYRRPATTLESRGPRAKMALPQIRYAMRFGDMLGSGLKKNRPSAD